MEKTLMWGKTEGKRRKRWQRIRWLDSITDSMDMNLNKLREIMEDRGPSRLQFMDHKESGMTQRLKTSSSGWTCGYTVSSPKPPGHPRAHLVLHVPWFWTDVQ